MHWTEISGGNSTDFGGGTRLDRIMWREYGREKLLEAITVHEVSSLQGKMIYIFCTEICAAKYWDFHGVR
jgi:hypothetical protein